MSNPTLIFIRRRTIFFPHHCILCIHKSHINTFTRSIHPHTEALPAYTTRTWAMMLLHPWLLPSHRLCVLTWGFAVKAARLHATRMALIPQWSVLSFVIVFVAAMIWAVRAVIKDFWIWDKQIDDAWYGRAIFGHLSPFYSLSLLFYHLAFKF